MHRRKTKLLERTTRLTQKLGHGSFLVPRAKRAAIRGVRTTYRLHDTAGANRTSRKRFERTPPALDDVQRDVLADLRRQDYAVVPFADLVTDAALRESLEEDGAAFVESTTAALNENGGDVRDEAKDYLVRRYRRVSEIGTDTPWLRCCLSERLLGLANTYLGMWSKLEYVDFWYSVPVAADQERIQSQRWHRDHDDRHLLKAFLYLVDVDETAGPLEFVAASARGGTLADYYPWHPLVAVYPPADEFEQKVPAEAIRTFTGQAGTLVLCNTSGFHRGGFATAKPRVLATATYCSPASLAALTERNYRVPKGAADALNGPQRYAVT
jgi:hypothetical protein